MKTLYLFCKLGRQINVVQMFTDKIIITPRTNIIIKKNLLLSCINFIDDYDQLISVDKVLWKLVVRPQILYA